MAIATVVKVVDASALAAVLFGEPDGEMVTGLLTGSRLVAPALLTFELANVCVIKTRRHPQQSQALFDAFLLHTRLGIEEIAVDPAGVVILAGTTGLTAYDASYLWLARELGAELVTLDQRLAREAAKLV